MEYLSTASTWIFPAAAAGLPPDGHLLAAAVPTG